LKTFPDFLKKQKPPDYVQAVSLLFDDNIISRFSSLLVPKKFRVATAVAGILFIFSAHALKLIIRK
jgi:hypothetical protein